MTQKFITTTGEISVYKARVSHKVIVEKEKTYWFTFLMIGLILFLFLLLEREANSFREIARPFIIFIYIIPLIGKLLHLLFIKVWRNNFPIAEIKSLLLEKEWNELEERLVIRLKNGRQKIYIFRKSENQAEPFLELLKEQVPEQTSLA